MDIFEFELRYLAYRGLNDKFSLGISDEEIINLVKITDKGVLQKKITETTPDELKEITLKIYTNFKKDFLSKNGDKKVGKFTMAEYIGRLEYELKVIKEMGYHTYFLVVQDYINWSKANDIVVGPGRGSAAGSLLSYCIGIIDLDPLEYDLLFERFLNPARISMPDIDSDFEDIKRDEVIEYIKNKYGHDKVAYIGTYMKMAAKAAFKDIARTMGMSFDQSNRVSNMITGKTIEASISENNEFKALMESDNNVKNIVDLAIQIEGTIRQTGVHACGMIIAPEDVREYTPVFYPSKIGSRDKDESRVVTQYDGHYLEDIGLLKMDFLGLRNLTIIKDTIKVIAARHKQTGKKLDKIFDTFLETRNFYPPLDDKYTYETIFQKGDTSGVFQFESDGMKKWLINLKPTDINDLIAMVSLYRPGPMMFIPHYIDRKNGKEEISYMTDELYSELAGKYGREVANDERKKLTEDLSPFMAITYGIPIYQEQLIRIVQAVAGFSLAEADMLRRGVGKKIREVIEKIKKEFIVKAKDFRGYKEETSIYVYEKMIEPAADYSFNKSHAACYSLISYQTAYLKANYKIEFNAALLRSVEQETDKFAKFIDELKLGGMKILVPDVNVSFKHVAAIQDHIVIGFLAIKGVGSEVAEFIQDQRKNKGKFTSLEDFVKRCGEVLTKKTLESLAKSGALDALGDRKTIFANTKEILDFAKSGNTSQPMGLFDMGAIADKITFKQVYQTSLMERLFYEFEVFKTFVSSHPFDGLYTYIKKKFNFISMFKDVDDYGPIEFIGIVKSLRKSKNKGTFMTIEDISGEVDVYFKDTLDIQEFDILVMSGFKGKTIRIKQINRISLDELIEKVKSSGSYNIEDTVITVRAKRLGLSSNISIKEETAINEEGEEIGVDNLVLEEEFS